MIHKKIFYILIPICLSVFFLSCQDDYAPVYSETPDERLRKTLVGYDSLFLSAQYGWKGKLETKLGPLFFYYFDFEKEGKVSMLSDFNQTTAGTSKEGSWLVKALMRPTLSFDTYSYIHLPADPNGNVNGGPNGAGLLSDFQFAIIKATSDSIVLEGIQNGSRMILKKATQPEVATLTQGNMEHMLKYVSENKSLRIVLSDNKIFPVALSTISKNIASQYLTTDGTDIKELSTTFNFTPTGISLTTAFNINGYSFKEIKWNEGKQEFYLDETSKLINDASVYIFKPTLSLAKAIGSRYSFIQVPEGSDIYPLPGQSEEFITGYTQVKESLLAGQYKLNLKYINYSFDPLENVMIVEVNVAQNGAIIPCKIAYKYTLSEDGIFKFEFSGADDNGWAIMPDMFPILNYFDNDKFRVEYVGGGFSLLGGLFSEDNPGFFFTGYLAK